MKIVYIWGDSFIRAEDFKPEPDGLLEKNKSRRAKRLRKSYIVGRRRRRLGLTLRNNRRLRLFDWQEDNPRYLATYLRANYWDKARPLAKRSSKKKHGDPHLGRGIYLHDRNPKFRERRESQRVCKNELKDLYQK